MITAEVRERKLKCLYLADGDVGFDHLYLVASSDLPKSVHENTCDNFFIRVDHNDGLSVPIEDANNEQGNQNRYD